MPEQGTPEQCQSILEHVGFHSQVAQNGTGSAHASTSADRHLEPGLQCLQTRRVALEPLRPMPSPVTTKSSVGVPAVVGAEARQNGIAESKTMPRSDARGGLGSAVT